MWMSDSQKIGAAFCTGGGFFFLFGLMLFFDRALLAMGNILFLIGITLLLGARKTMTFFMKKEKLKGTACFALGVGLILAKYPLIGFVIETYGILVLFKDFVGVVAGFVGAVPVVGPYIEAAVNKITGGSRTLPV